MEKLPSGPRAGSPRRVNENRRASVNDFMPGAAGNAATMFDMCCSEARARRNLERKRRVMRRWAHVTAAKNDLPTPGSWTDSPQHRRKHSPGRRESPTTTQKITRQQEITAAEIQLQFRLQRSREVKRRLLRLRQRSQMRRIRTVFSSWSRLGAKLHELRVKTLSASE